MLQTTHIYSVVWWLLSNRHVLELLLPSQLRQKLLLHTSAAPDLAKANTGVRAGSYGLVVVKVFWQQLWTVLKREGMDGFTRACGQADFL